MKKLLLLCALLVACVLVVEAAGQRRMGLVRGRGTAEGGEPPGEFAFTTGGHNGNWTDLCASEWSVACYGLRDDTEINLYDVGGGAGEGDVAYDSTEDAAQWTWLTDEKNGERLYLPLNEVQPTAGYPFPVSGTDTMLIVSDVRLDDTWDTECNMSPPGRTCGWKMMQLARGNNNNIGDTFFEYQNYIAQNSVPLLGSASPNGWHAPYFRTYPTVTSSMGGYICTADTADRVALGVDDNPTLNGDTDCFISLHSTWMRYFTKVVRTAGNTYLDVSVWMADETTEPISLVEDVRITNADGALDLFYYWMEWDTSSETRTGGTMKAQMRNFVALRNPTVTITDLMRKPLATNKWTYQQSFDSYSTAVLHGQDSWTALNVAGETAYTVQTGTVSDGTKAVAMALETHPRIERTLPASLATGDFVVRMRKSHATDTEMLLRLVDTGNSTRVFVRFGEYGNPTDTNLAGYDNGAYVNAATGLLANTWYDVNVQFSSTTDQFRLRVKATSSSTWGSWTDWLDYNGATGSNIEKIELTGEGDGGTLGHVGYWDLLMPWRG